MDRFEQSVTHTLRALQVMRSRGHTGLCTSTGTLAALVNDMSAPAMSVAEPGQGRTSDLLREHFARGNAKKSEPTPATTPPSAPATVPEVDHPAHTVTQPVSGDKAATLKALESATSTCELCPLLAGSRNQVVFGSGSINADIMFVGQAPGSAEDKTGDPFSGAAGDMLANILKAMGLATSDVYFSNVLKCHPDTAPGSPDDRPPSPHEMANCLPYLRQQITSIQPKVIVALGAIAMEGLIGLKAPVYKMRGRWHMLESIPIMATFHPSFLLQQPNIANKRKAWEDMLQVMTRLGMPVSEKQQNFFRTNPSTS